jgi:hypothetical protein
MHVRQVAGDGTRRVAPTSDVAAIPKNPAVQHIVEHTGVDVSIDDVSVTSNSGLEFAPVP